MDLGLFSVSLAVKDLAASKAFYQKLGFESVHGDGEHFDVLANGTTLIGLFEQMFEGNILTFNPGWTGRGEELDEFTDVRDLRNELATAGMAIVEDHTGESPSGPAHFTLLDPDGNAILIDQHV